MDTYYKPEDFPTRPISVKELPNPLIELLNQLTQRKVFFAIRGGLSLELATKNFEMLHHDLDILADDIELNVWLKEITPFSDSYFINQSNIHGKKVLTLFFKANDNDFYQVDVRFHSIIPDGICNTLLPNGNSLPFCPIEFAFWERVAKIIHLYDNKEFNRIKKHIEMLKYILLIDVSTNKCNDVFYDKCEFYNIENVIRLFGIYEVKNLFPLIRQYLIRHKIEFFAPYRRLLFCRFRAPGDIIRTFPIISGIKYFHPEIEIGYLCYERHADLVQCNKDISYIHTVNEIEEPGKRIDFRPWEKTIVDVKKLNYDLFFDLHGISHSGLFGFIAEIKQRIGFTRQFVKEGADIFYTNTFELPQECTNRFLRHEFLVQQFFPYVSNMLCRQLDISETEKTCILICPGSSQVGILKRWPLSSYIELGNLLSNQGEDIVFALGNEDSELYQEIKDKGFRVKMFDDIRELFFSTKNAKCVIGNDSAWLHAACVQGTPNVMIVGPSSHVICHTNDITPHKTIFASPACSPCKIWEYKCPNKHICMKQVKVQDVLYAVNELIK